MDRSGTRCAPPCGIGIRTRCRSCSRCPSSVAWIGIWPGSRRRWWVIRKREPRWQSAADRARVAAELIEEAASLTDESTIATPADVARAALPPPISVELPLSAAPGGEAGAASDAPLVAPTLDDALDRDPDNVALLVERAARLGAAQHYSAAQRDYARALRVDPAHGEALIGLGVLLSRRGLWSEALLPLRRATEVDPGRAAAWYYLGEPPNHVADLTAPQAAYHRAVELQPP